MATRTRHWWPRLPGPLLAVAGATAVAAVFGLAGHGVAGSVPSGLPPVGIPDLRPSDLRELLGPALGVLVVAFSDVPPAGTRRGRPRGWRSPVVRAQCRGQCRGRLHRA